MRMAVIPARGGSKRIPRKNVREFCGRPMIAWPISAALASRQFDRVIVSTDDAEIAGVARAAGAEVPFVRPPELSNDHAGTIEVIAHATRWAQDVGLAPDLVCCIYATAAFVDVGDLARGRAALESGDWDYAFAATEFPAPIFRSFEETPAGGVRMFFPEYETTRSQDLPVALHDAGQFYWGTARAWLGRAPIFSARSRPVPIPRVRSQDIDTPADWEFAELLFRTTNIQNTKTV